MKILKGRLSISRPHGNNRDEVRIILIDEASGCELVEVRLAKGDFADALFGLGRVPCDYEYQEDCPAGQKREVKSERVMVPERHGKGAAKNAAIRAAVAAQEIDGWKGRDSDADNMHNYRGEKDGCVVFDVTYIRFVDPA